MWRTSITAGCVVLAILGGCLLFDVKSGGKIPKLGPLVPDHFTIDPIDVRVELDMHDGPFSDFVQVGYVILAGIGIILAFQTGRRLLTSRVSDPDRRSGP